MLVDGADNKLDCSDRSGSNSRRAEKELRDGE